VRAISDSLSYAITSDYVILGTKHTERKCGEYDKSKDGTHLDERLQDGTDLRSLVKLL